MTSPDARQAPSRDRRTRAVRWVACVGLTLLVTLPALAQDTWMRHFQTLDGDIFSWSSGNETVASQGADGLVFAAARRVDVGEYRCVFTALDPLGNVRWSWETSERCVGPTVHAVGDGSWMLLGGMFDASDNITTWLARLESDGTPSWGRRALSHDFQDLRKARDGGWLVTGSLELNPAGYHDRYVQRLDPAGGVVWTLGLQGDRVVGVSALAELADGSWLVEAGPPSNMVLKISAVGELEWTRRLEGGGPIEASVECHNPTDRAWIILMATRVEPLDTLMLLRLAADGESFELHGFEPSDGGLLSPVSCEGTADGGAVFGAAYTAVGGDPTGRDPWWARVESDGSLRASWLRAFPHSEQLFGLSVDATDGRIVATGAGRADSERFLDWVMLADADGWPGPPCVEALPLAPVTWDVTWRDQNIESYPAEVPWTDFLPAFVPGRALAWVDTCCPFEVAPPPAYPPGGEPGFRLDRRYRPWDAERVSVHEGAFPGACSWSYYEGTLSELRAGRGDAECVAADLSELMLDDPREPRAGGTYSFVVGRNLIGDGSAGIDSLGGERVIAMPCP